MITYYLKTDSVAIYPIAISPINIIYITCPLLPLMIPETIVYNTDNNNTTTINELLYNAKQQSTNDYIGNKTKPTW